LGRRLRPKEGSPLRKKKGGSRTTGAKGECGALAWGTKKKGGIAAEKGVARSEEKIAKGESRAARRRASSACKKKRDRSSGNVARSNGRGSEGLIAACNLNQDGKRSQTGERKEITGSLRGRAKYSLGQR